MSKIGNSNLIKESNVEKMLMIIALGKGRAFNTNLKSDKNHMTKRVVLKAIENAKTTSEAKCICDYVRNNLMEFSADPVERVDVMEKSLILYECKIMELSRVPEQHISAYKRLSMESRGYLPDKDCITINEATAFYKTTKSIYTLMNTMFRLGYARGLKSKEVRK